MATDPASPRSRRALLAAAAGGAAGIAAAQLARPLAASAAPYNLQAETTNVTTAGTTIQGGYFNTLSVSAFGGGASAIVATATASANAISASADSYDALSGLANTGTGAHGSSNSGFGVDGFCNTGVGVRGSSNSGVGVFATATTGAALKIEGKAKFSRSGRATVLKGKYYVDITVPGGLEWHSLVHATLQTYRAGVAIAAVRANYPSPGKARIYLTRVASTTSGTYVAWFVAEY